MKSERLALSCLLVGIAAVSGNIYAQEAVLSSDVPQVSGQASDPSQVPGPTPFNEPNMENGGRSAYGEPGSETSQPSGQATGQMPDQTTGQAPYGQPPATTSSQTPFAENMGQTYDGAEIRGQAAYGDGANVYTERTSIYCSTPDADWNFNDPNCPASSHLWMSQGRAAYGEPTSGQESMMGRGTSIYCSTPDADWNFNDPNCPNYISVSDEGRAAYGESGRAGMEMRDRNLSIYCSTPDADWNFNDPNCHSYLGEYGTTRSDQ